MVEKIDKLPKCAENVTNFAYAFYFIPPPSRAVGGVRGRSVSVSTATLGLIHRQDPTLATQLREDPASMMSQRTRRRVYSTMRLIRTGLIGQMASLQQWEKAMNDQDDL